MTANTSDIEHDAAAGPRSEDARHHDQRRLQAVLAATVDGIIILDGAGRIDSVNPAVENMFGYTEGELVGENVSVLMPEPHRSEHDRYLRRYTDTGQARVIGIGREVLGRRKDGSVFPVGLSVSEFHLDGRRMFAGVIRDITALRQAERTISDQRDEMAELLSIVSHDLKQPLVSIEWVLSLAKTGADSREPGSHLDLIRRECRHMKAMLSELTNVLNIQQGEVRKDAANLRTLVRDVVDRFAELIQQHQVELVLDVPDVEIVCPAVQVAQALGNLVQNGIYYGCPRAGCRLEITGRVGPRNVALQVRDEGPGIAPEHHQRVFEPFKRLQPDHAAGGTGLGLTGVLRLMKRIGGDVSLESETGRGACFTLSFPIENTTPGPEGDLPSSG